MAQNNRDFRTPSRTSPKGGERGCLCKDDRYSRKCCDGSLQAQGIGSITRISTPQNAKKTNKSLY
jgi:hypothetical protein